MNDFEAVIFERNEAIKSWDNGRVWFGICHYTKRNEADKSWDNGCIWLGINNDV